MKENKAITLFNSEFNQLISFFPDPFLQELHQDAKTVFIIEHKKVRKIMDKVLIKLQKLLALNLKNNQLKSILKSWQELQILKTFYIKRFNTSDLLHSSYEDMNAYITLKQIILEYEFFLKVIKYKLSE